MRISDWSSDVCSSDLRRCDDGSTSAPSHQPIGGAGTVAKFIKLPLNSLYSRIRSRTRGRWCWCWCRSEEHTSELQSLMRISYAVFCLKKKIKTKKKS